MHAHGRARRYTSSPAGPAAASARRVACWLSAAASACCCSMDAAVTETRSTCIQRARPADDDKVMPIVPQRQGEGCKTQTIDGCDGVGVPLHHIIPMVIILLGSPPVSAKSTRTCMPTRFNTMPCCGGSPAWRDTRRRCSLPAAVRTVRCSDCMQQDRCFATRRVAGVLKECHPLLG